jgi:hypothetical protein
MVSTIPGAVRVREAAVAVLGTIALSYLPLRLVVLRSPEFRENIDWALVIGVFVGLPFVAAFLLFHRLVAVAHERRTVAAIVLALSVAAIPYCAAFGLFRFEPRLHMWPYSVVFGAVALLAAPSAFRSAQAGRIGEVAIIGGITFVAAIFTIWILLLAFSAVG